MDDKYVRLTFTFRLLDVVQNKWIYLRNDAW